MEVPAFVDLIPARASVAGGAAVHYVGDEQLLLLAAGEVKGASI
jgi:hypothetical protein